MNIKTDFHIHTNASTDSDQNPIGHINKAISLGFTSICFTDHNDFDYPIENGKQDFQLDFDTYFSTISELKAKYMNKIDIKIGVEQGLSLSAIERIEKYDPNHLLDFIIGSSHMVYNMDPYYPEIWEKYNISRAIDEYYQSIADNIKQINNYDVYGHLDYIIRYIPDKSYKYDWKQNFDIIEHILKELIHKGKGIEINTAGLRHNLEFPNPNPEILSLYRQLGGEIITVGSDAHFEKHLGCDFDIAYKYLCEAGFKYYTVFDKRKHEFIKM